MAGSFEDDDEGDAETYQFELAELVTAVQTKVNSIVD